MSFSLLNVSVRYQVEALFLSQAESNYTEAKRTRKCGNCDALQLETVPSFAALIKMPVPSLKSANLAVPDL